MRIVQIIDSLEIGGAEKMAVNYANALSDKIEFSGLVVTRKEGELKKQLNSNVHYLFLVRNRTFDLKSVKKLLVFCNENKVEFLHAHSSSYFIAILVKFLKPSLKIIWHNHNGMSEKIGLKETYLSKIASYFFEGIIVVNQKLKFWALEELKCKSIIYLSNFSHLNHDNRSITELKGQQGKRILCLANLRRQKNHYFLLAIAEKIKYIYPEWTFHVVGKDFFDDYSEEIKSLIKEKKLQETVFVYGSRNDINEIINQSDIAILTSLSEGLPIALIEYGLSKKPVVSTNVGEIPLIIKDGENGFITSVNDVEMFTQRILELIKNEVLRSMLGDTLHKTIVENHSEEGVMKKYLNWLEKL